MTPQQKRKATEAARRVVAAYAACRQLPGRWVEKDAITLADYVLALRDEQVTQQQRGTP